MALHYHTYTRRYTTTLNAPYHYSANPTIVHLETCPSSHAYCKIKDTFFTGNRDWVIVDSEISKPTTSEQYGAGHMHNLIELVADGDYLVYLFCLLQTVDRCPLHGISCSANYYGTGIYETYLENSITTDGIVGDPDGVHYHTYKAAYDFEKAANLFGIAITTCPLGHSRCQVNVSSSALKFIAGSTGKSFDTANSILGGHPIVIALAASTIGATYATSNGQITDDGEETCQWRFRYRELGGSYSYTDWANNKVTGNLFSATITGLTEGTIYEFAAQGKNSIGEGNWSATLEFMTLSPRATVAVQDKITLESIRNIEMSARGRFRISKDGDAVYRSRYARNV